MTLVQSLTCGLFPSWSLQKEIEQCVHTFHWELRDWVIQDHSESSTGKIDYNKRFLQWKSYANLFLSKGLFIGVFLIARYKMAISSCFTA